MDRYLWCCSFFICASCHFFIIGKFFSLLPPCFLLYLVSIYYTKKKDRTQSSQWFSGYCDFCPCRYGILLFFWPHFWWKNLVGSIVSKLIFIGTTLYVKSMMRERKNPLYLKASIIFHVLCVLGCLFTQQYVLSLAFVPALIRAIICQPRNFRLSKSV